MRLLCPRSYLRLHPPTLLWCRAQLHQKSVDLLTLTPETDVEVLVNQIVRQEPLISDHRKPQLRKLIYKLCATGAATIPPAPCLLTLSAPHRRVSLAQHRKD